jgi:hypothetical protein
MDNACGPVVQCQCISARSLAALGANKFLVPALAMRLSDKAGHAFHRLAGSIRVGRIGVDGADEKRDAEKKD